MTSRTLQRHFAAGRSRIREAGTVNERTRKLEAIFHTAQDLDSAAERERYLDQVCGGDSELRREVEELLRLGAAAEKVFQVGQNACQVAEADPAITLAE